MSDLKLAANFMSLDAADADLHTARVAILPVPYDKTSSWQKGADLGPQAIINASALLELFDPVTRANPAERGIATLPALTTSLGPERLAPLVQDAVGGLLQRGKLPVILGGEHSVSIGAIRAAAERFGDLTVLQIDAHADTRDTYFGGDHAHACVMARAREVAQPIHVGIRSLEAEEHEAIDTDRLFLVHDVLADEPGTIDRVIALCTGHVYLTIDLDGLDPSLMPSTGTPEPPGLTWRFVTSLIARVAERSRIVAFDVVELAPRPGQHASEVVAARLVSHTIALINRAGSV